MGWLRLVGSIKDRSLLQKSPIKETILYSAKETYYIPQKRPIYIMRKIVWLAIDGRSSIGYGE